jgi:uroporphyrinogen-III decarboxylase
MHPPFTLSRDRPPHSKQGHRFTMGEKMMREIDFVQHNKEVTRIWASFEAGQPIRVPVGHFTIGARIWMGDPALNTEGITWEAFSENPAIMYDVQLQYKYYLHHHVIHDIKMGIPENGWTTGLNFNNVTEFAWLGNDILYPRGRVPISRPKYAGDRRYEVLEKGMPGPFDGFMGKVREYYEYFGERASRELFHGKPVHVDQPGLRSDGPFTIAVGIRGQEILYEMLADPDYYHALMEFITEATIRRIVAWRAYHGVEERPQCGSLADDAIQMLSTETYKACVLPYHKQFFEALYGEGPHGMHLCGNVQRHLPTIVEELNVKSFDTGYPIRFETLREEVGEDVLIQGGVHVGILRNGSVEDVTRETKQILKSGIKRGGKFIMKEANNMPPLVPLENLWAMYETVRQYGRYDPA